MSIHRIWAVWLSAPIDASALRTKFPTWNVLNATPTSAPSSNENAGSKIPTVYWRCAFSAIVVVAMRCANSLAMARTVIALGDASKSRPNGVVGDAG